VAPFARTRSGRAALLGATVVAAAACQTSTSGGSPRATLERFYRAAHRDDAAALYELLPARARANESLATFRARLARDRVELHGVATAVQRTLGAGTSPHLEVPTGDDGVATVVADADGWRVAQSGLGPVAAASPADAVRALRAALQRGNLAALLYVLSDRARGALQAELAALVAALGDPDGLEPTTTPAGQHLELRLPDGRTVVLVREGPAWRVDDVR
jgi:hypothetical protein